MKDRKLKNVAAREWAATDVWLKQHRGKHDMCWMTHVELAVTGHVNGSYASRRSVRLVPR